MNTTTHSKEATLPKKSWNKKAAFKAFCRKQVMAGLINNAEGNWQPFSTTKAMDRDMRAGYKVK